MIYFLFGEDFSIVNKKVNELISKLNISNIIKYDFSSASLNEIIDEVNYVDLFNEKKLIIVSSFSFKSLNKEDEVLLSNYIENMNENVIIFKCNNETLDERKSLTKLIRSKCKVESIEKLDYKTLHEYVSKMFEEKGITTTFNQIKKILDLCEYNPDYTINEVEKLLIYKIGDSVLYDKDIDDVISKNNEKEMFNLTESILDKNISSSLESYKILNSSDVDPIVLIDNIAKQFRLLMQIKILKGKNEAELSKILGANPFVIRKLIPYVSSYSIDEIADKLLSLSDMDIDVKVNGYDKNYLLESFIIKL